jgi:uncharacterized RDD family membrane protein YckC
MTHVNILRVVNYLYGALLFFAALLMFGAGGSRDGIYALAAIVGFVFGVLAIVSGIRVADGEGRGLQTLVAVLSATSFPIGTIYCAYAIYVCWINAESRACFRAR